MQQAGTLRRRQSRPHKPAVVTATSQGDPTKSASATLTLDPGQGVTTTGPASNSILNLIADALCRRPHVPPTVTIAPDQYTALVCPTLVACRQHTFSAI